MDVLLLDDLAPDARQWLAARHAVDYRPWLVGDAQPRGGWPPEVRALLAPPCMKVNAHLLDALPKLVVVARLHGGVDTIDYEACQRRLVRVVQATDAGVRASAEFQLATLLALYRGADFFSGGGGAWARHAPGRELNDHVVALFGMTPAAQLLATMLVPLGVRLVGYDPALHRKAELWRRLRVQPLALDEMLHVADAVAMQMVHATRYHGLVNARVLARCKPGQVWSSISQPALIEPLALAEALRSGRIGAFALDTAQPDVAGPGSPLAGLPGLRITPHLAQYTQEAMLRASWFVADRIHESLRMAVETSGSMPLEAALPSA